MRSATVVLEKGADWVSASLQRRRPEQPIGIELPSPPTN